MSKKKKDRPESPLPIDKLERNTFTLSLVVLLLGLLCLPNVETGGDTWFVLMFVFALNVILIGWIASRIVRRIIDAKKEQKQR